jgi:UDP-glucuronate decarboxylase
MLGLAKRSGARILFTSTSEIYGDPQIHPQPEYYLGNVNTIGPRACYDEGKRISETLMTDYKRVNNVQIRIARIFNTYGPRMLKNDGRVVSNFITQALANKPITVYGTGTQTRCFCYVDDMVAGLKKLMDSDCSKPINLGNPVEITVNELAMRISNKINSALPHVNLPLPEDDPPRRNPDITLAKETLNWLPTVSLDDGLEETIDYFKSFKKITWNKEAAY